MESAHGGEVGGEAFRVSGHQLLDEKPHILLNDFTESLRLGVAGSVAMLLVSGCVGWVLFIGWFLYFEWLCCVCSKTRLGYGPRQRGWQVQREGSLPGLQRRAKRSGGLYKRAGVAKRGR